MTFGELVHAMQTWGVQENDVIFGMRVQAGNGRVGIRRTPKGIQVVTLGAIRATNQVDDQGEDLGPLDVLSVDSNL